MFNQEYLFKDYHALKITWLHQEIVKLPQGTIVKRNKNGRFYQSVRVYELTKSGIKRRLEISSNSEKGRELSDKIELREKYKHELSELETMWKNSYKFQPVSPVICKEFKTVKTRIGKVAPSFSLGKKTFDDVIPETNSYPKERWNESDGINFRSIQERMIAEVIKAMGIDFKYEVTVQVGDSVLSSDFLIYVRELDVVKFIEFLGMMDDPEYRAKSYKKMEKYHMAGLVEDRDVLYLFANSHESINSKMVAARINAMLFNHM